MILRKNNTAVLTGLLLALASGTVTHAQVCHNLYPSPEMATYDNNGHDLRGFVLSNKKDLLFKGGKVNEYSKNSWGYIQVSTNKVPSIQETARSKENLHKLNYSETIDVTSVMYKTKDGAECTWWARQCNNPKGPLVDMRVEPGDLLNMDYVRYGNVLTDLSTKQFTMVEYSGDSYNKKDYDDLVKNYVLIQNGLIKNIDDYGTIIDYYNNFTSKFSEITDPLLEYKSFITFFETPRARYAGYFNVVNNKLAGKLETVDITYDRDKTTFVNDAFKKVTGSVVYVYGDEAFGLNNEIRTYAREHQVKVIRRKTTTSKDFNKDISIHQANASVDQP